MWLNLGIAALLLTATIVGFFLALRVVRGEGLPQLSRKQDDAKPQAEDIEQIIAAYRREKAAAGADAAPAARADSAAAGRTEPRIVAPPSATPPQAATVRPKAAFLNGPNKLLYLVLKAALPDHQVFANVRLADAVQIAEKPATPQARAQLAQARVDFVVCNAQLAVVALVDITDGNRADDALKRQIAPQITGAGGRYLRVAPTAIPKPAEARTLVCGA
jgi:hypothetical protein